ncbi:MAG: hypothetical protein K2I72_00965, partial [Bacilli bacterium]|nr:hypothetical protein [Bacilli bacterium]
HYDNYKDFVRKFSKQLTKEELKDIPAVFGVSFDNLKDVLELGYDINCVDEEGNSILMDYLSRKDVTIEIIDSLDSFGVNPNYQNPKTGNSALSCVIMKLPIYDFGNFIRNCDRNTNELCNAPEEYEKEIKALVKRIIDLSSTEIVTSESVKQAVYHIIKPGYPQIIYSEILEALSKKGFKVDDDYFTKSITFLDEMYSKDYITKPWEYLWNLYSNFDNKSIGTNHEFPRIADAKKYEYGTEESNLVFSIISEHLSRNFATTKEQVKNPEKIVGKLTSLEKAQNTLLGEIERYIGILDYRQIMTLIDSFPIIDVGSIIRSNMLLCAIYLEDIDLCKELSKRGCTIVCFDENGTDITSKRYTPEQISLFSSINKEYN